ncbi:MAG: hypothetical protein WC602_06675 [archaeon]
MNAKTRPPESEPHSNKQERGCFSRNDNKTNPAKAFGAGRSQKNDFLLALKG